jgi:hypothetical protein
MGQSTSSILYSSSSETSNGTGGAFQASDTIDGIKAEFSAVVVASASAPASAPTPTPTQPQDKKTSHTEQPDNNNETKEKRIILQRNVNILTMPYKELKEHVQDYAVHMTKFDVRNVASTLTFSDEPGGGEGGDGEVATQEIKLDDEWYTNSTSMNFTINKKNGTFDDDNDNDKEVLHTKMEVALFILKTSPEIKSLRFKLVPSKISECHFWSSVFFILEYFTPNDLGMTETIIPSTKKKAISSSSTGSSIITTISNSSGGGSGGKKGQDVTTAAVVSNVNAAIMNSKECNSNHRVYKIKIQQQNDELTSLRLQLTKAKKEVLSFQQKQQKQQKQLVVDDVTVTDTDTNEATTITNTSINLHAGKWSMSAESNEFISLDEEIKQKLRHGKQKRLHDVLEQMKFIMDSDDVKDSQGKWECCGQTVYDSPCECR